MLVALVDALAELRTQGKTTPFIRFFPQIYTDLYAF